jgi:oxygen-independent coproporphyrinogen-3 oxidase
MRNLAVYVHVPFCEFKCGYCDFSAVQIGNSGTNLQFRALVDDYRSILRAELNQQAEVLRECEVSSIFFGGGTPTVLRAKDICGIIQDIHDLSCGISKTAEITVETNPGINCTNRAEYLRTLHSGGVNRLSVGVQSFDTAVLRTLERAQRFEDVPQIVQEAKNLELKTSLDLIYGTPTETLESWENSVKSAVELDPDHLSAYALTLEDGVRLAKQIARGKLEQLDDDSQARKYELADEILSSSGYAWYEISNWEKLTSRPGENQSKHNLTYWKDGEYLGIGPSAHSSLRMNSSHTQKRFWNTPALHEYAQLIRSSRSAVAGGEELTAREKLYENAMLNARLNKPITNCTRSTLDQLLERELVSYENYKPTLKGRLLNDEIVRVLVEDELQMSSSQVASCSKYNTSQCLSCPQCVVE